MASLAFGFSSGSSSRSMLEQAREFLLSRQSPTGHWWITPEEKVAAWETPLVLMAFGREPRFAEACRLGLDAYLRIEAEAVNPSGITVDSRWRGWNWHPPTPGWVEPTSMALLAAQRLQDLVQPRLLSRRLEDGRRFLLDRLSPDGGWNYGNSYVLGKAVSPMLAPTAMALLALRSLASSEVRITKALEYLENGLLLQPTGWSLSWGIMALSAYDRPTERMRQGLGSQWRHSRFLGNLAVASLALLAMQVDGNHHPFRFQ